MPYGISAYGQSAQIGSPLQHTGALIQQHMGSGTTTIYAGSESNGSPAAVSAVVSTSALQTTSSQSTSSLFRTGEEKRLTREAMERYLRDRNDMIVVVLHAKVISCAVEVIRFVCISPRRTIAEVLKLRLILFNHHRRAGDYLEKIRWSQRKKIVSQISAPTMGKNFSIN